MEAVSKQSNARAMAVFSCSICSFHSWISYHLLTISRQRQRFSGVTGSVRKSGHIGVYIGNGEVIEAMGTKYGVVKTQLEGRGWTHWLEIPYINYD